MISTHAGHCDVTGRFPRNLIRGKQKLLHFWTYYIKNTADMDASNPLLIPEGFYDDLPSLVVFALAESAPVVRFPKKDGVPVNFLAKSKELVEFYHCCKTPIDDFPVQLFHDQEKIQKVDLWGNIFPRLRKDMFKGCKVLRKLNMNGNMMQSIPAGFFDELGKLTDLWLHNNLLTELAAGLFDKLKILEFIDLKGNLLAKLPSTFLAVEKPALKYIDVDNNVLACPVVAEEGGAASGVAMDKCRCSKPEDADITYKFMPPSATAAAYECASTFAPGSAKCVGDATQQRGDAACSEGLCRHHCCGAGVDATCKACGATSGACYKPLALRLVQTRVT